MDPAAIFRAAGVDPEALRVPGKRISLRVAQRLWQVVDEVVGDPGFGIAVAKQMHGTALHALGYAWLSSATLGEALRRFARYSRVLTDLWSLQIDDNPRGTQISFVFAAKWQHPSLWLNDWLIAGIVQLCRLNYGEAFTPLEVTLVRNPPERSEPFHEWFRCPIVWGAPRVSGLFRREDLTQALPTANPDVALANERVVLEYLERLDRNDVLAQVRRRILEQLPSGRPTQVEVARRLALSPRTLHRRLVGAGTSFEELLDETRRELATGYLQRTDSSIGEVAYLLGFAEVSSFNRAFRRWTGRPPSALREAPGGPRVCT